MIAFLYHDCRVFGFVSSESINTSSNATQAGCAPRIAEPTDVARIHAPFVKCNSNLLPLDGLIYFLNSVCFFRSALISSSLCAAVSLLAEINQTVKGEPSPFFSKRHW